MNTKIITLFILALFSLQLSAQNEITAYAWKAGIYTTPLCQGPLSITIPDGELTSIECYQQPDYYFIHGADWIDNKWYGLIYDTSGGDCPLITVDTQTGAVDTIGLAGPSITGLAHDYSTGTTYVQDFGGGLSTINLATAELTNIGATGLNGLALACDLGGQLYCVDYDNNLSKVDKNTGATELVGSLGIEISGENGLCFDRYTNKLYGLLSASDPAEKGLCEIDINTGNATVLSNNTYNISGLAIPYDPTTGIENITIEEIKIYPVPSNGVFNISVTEDFHLSVYSQTGRMVKSEHINSESTIDLSEEAIGLYILNLVNNKGEYFTKRVVIR